MNWCTIYSASGQGRKYTAFLNLNQVSLPLLQWMADQGFDQNMRLQFRKYIGNNLEILSYFIQWLKISLTLSGVYQFFSRKTFIVTPTIIYKEGSNKN